MTNQALVHQLRIHAANLAKRRENLYRVRAFRQAAFAISGLPVSVDEIVRKSPNLLRSQIPGIGDHIASTLIQFVRTGQWPRE